MSFYIVYIQEAHPTDGWQVQVNEDEGVTYAQPASAEQRQEVAAACALGLNLSIPALIDGIDNAVDRAYAALPDRLYLVDAAGRIAYRSGPGPWGFNPDELAAAISALLSPAGAGVDSPAGTREAPSAP